MVAVIGSGQKVGRSTVAAAIALTLGEKRKEHVVLLEGDPHSSFLKPTADTRIISVVEAASTLTPKDKRKGKTILSMLSRTPNGMYVLPAQGSGNDVASPEDYSTVIKAFKKHIGRHGD